MTKINSNKLFTIDPYSLDLKEKEKIMINIMNELTDHHYIKSKNYKKLLNFLNLRKKKYKNLNDIPFLPVRLFKDFKLKSVNDNKIIKILQSSGTTGLKTSKIFLDNKNSQDQSKALNKIIKKLLGEERLPMLIIDKRPNQKDRTSINARTAAINGFSIFGKDHLFLINDKNLIDYKNLNIFLEKFHQKKFFVFGFTSFVYQNLIQKLLINKISYSFKNAILLHGGGWKKMEKIKITNEKFKYLLKKKLDLRNVHNYYGLVEQTGSIFIECKCGFFVTSVFSDILIRDKNFNLVRNGSKGLIQLLSTLPSSYPGHSILTEDIGQIISDTKCNCSIKGKKFLVHGRIAEAEIRGCSDV